jgi:uncharacterized membrane protein YvlD (DUF360 family)
MIALVIKLALRVVLFGVALAFATRSISGVTITPRKALPLVALVLALLNAVAYTILSAALNIFTLGVFFFLVPFFANGVLLYAADRFLKPFHVDGMVPLVKLSAVMTLLHVVLQVARL